MTVFFVFLMEGGGHGDGDGGGGGEIRTNEIGCRGKHVSFQASGNTTFERRRAVQKELIHANHEDEQWR